MGGVARSAPKRRVCAAHGHARAAKTHKYIFLALKIYYVIIFFADYISIDSFTLIHIFKPIHTHIDTPVHQYQADPVIHRYTNLALKIYFVLTYFADYSRIDSFTLIHIFKPIHTQIDTPEQANINRPIQSYIDTHIKVSRYICSYIL
jgi:hypothetical protein